MTPASAAAAGPEPGQRAEVVERADPAAGDQRHRARVEHRGRADRTSGPSSVPSRPISVTISAASPMPSKRWASSTRSAPEPSAQPRIATSLPRASSPTATRPGYSTHSSSTSAGRSTAAVPTRRARPRRRAARSAASAVRTPPPTSTRQATLRTIRRIWSRWVRSPVRAASRSTTWIHRAPAASNSRATAHRVVVVDGLGGEVALEQADAVPAAQVDGGKQLDHDGELRACPWSTARRCPRSSPRRAAPGPRP